jgi:hypothetical protein
MTTEEKRQAIHEWCNSHNFETCMECPHYNNRFCTSFSISSASAELIDKWHDLFFPEKRILISIPKDGQYIEILGHKIDGFESFEAFCEHLAKYAMLEHENKKLRSVIEELQKEVKSLCRILDNALEDNHERI